MFQFSENAEKDGEDDAEEDNMASSPSHEQFPIPNDNTSELYGCKRRKKRDVLILFSKQIPHES